jgi:hypothetical protein
MELVNGSLAETEKVEGKKASVATQVKRSPHE